MSINTNASTTKNFSLYALPAAALLPYFPYLIKILTILNQTGEWNHLSPRTNLEKCERKMTKSAFEMAKRCDAAHYNGLESFPIFATAVLVANWTGVPRKTLNKWSKIFIASRILYNLSYMTGVRNGVAYTRSALFLAGLISSFILFLQAARKVNDDATKVDDDEDDATKDDIEKSE
ncbi:hypothetical protein G9A89_019158 [Geosiphon pyriformis]|nr:hypothetical protein G9A89_019158 [Geosiphon pyriformis]